MSDETMFEHAGGAEAIHRLEDAFYTSVLHDPLLKPLFGAGQPDHVDHLTSFTGESFGGPDTFTRESASNISSTCTATFTSPRSNGNGSSISTALRSSSPTCPPTLASARP